MATPKKYFCEGCPGTFRSRPVPHMGDMTGEQMNGIIREMKHGDARKIQLVAERACSMIQSEPCSGPEQQDAVRFDSEGENYPPGQTDTVCGRDRHDVADIARVIMQNPSLRI